MATTKKTRKTYNPNRRTACPHRNKPKVETREGIRLCFECATRIGFCETCGSVRIGNQKPSQQKHYSEECFK